VCGASQPSKRKTCSTCSRDRIPPWLLDVHGRAILPGSIVRCPKGSARYAAPPPPPPPPLPGEDAGATISPRNRGRLASPSQPGSLTSRRSPKAGASSPTEASLSP
ncbi:unnamed protein product, partial [Ectocarpus sp. 13 AM-2016]